MEFETYPDGQLAPGTTPNPRHGIHNPVTSTPQLRKGVVRRSATTTMTRPDGVMGDLHMDAVARDVFLDANGNLKVLGTNSLFVLVEYLNLRRISKISSQPEIASLQNLIGASAAAGFRARMMDLVPEEKNKKSLLYLLLDDVPVAALISGSVLGLANAEFPEGASAYVPQPNLCSGWRDEGTIMIELNNGRRSPVVTGPLAPELHNPNDLDGLHKFDPLPAWGARRFRRLDVWRNSEGLLEIDCHFRDSKSDADAVEVIIHEYLLKGLIEPETLKVLTLSAEARTLPWMECPHAAESATDLVGRSLHESRAYIREEFVGIHTCTHLNDTMRTLEDLSTLERYL